MMSVVLIVVGGLAFTVVMQAVAIDVLAVRANRAELAAANALTSGVNIVTSDIRRHGPSHYPADPLVIDRYLATRTAIRDAGRWGSPTR